MSNNFQTITGLNTAKSLTVASGATGAVITVEEAPVRWRGDGTAPTSAIGHLMAVDTWIVYHGTRHSMITQSRECGLDSEIRKGITGHAFTDVGKQ